MIDSHLGLKLLRTLFINCTGTGRTGGCLSVWTCGPDTGKSSEISIGYFGESFVEWNDAVEPRVELRSTIFAPHRLPEQTLQLPQGVTALQRTTCASKPTNQRLTSFFTNTTYPIWIKFAGQKRGCEQLPACSDGR